MLTPIYLIEESKSEAEDYKEAQNYILLISAMILAWETAPSITW